MKTQELNSIQANLTAFTKKLSDAELIELIRYVCYTAVDDKTQATQTQLEFVDEFFGKKGWADNLDDERNENVMFLRTSMSMRDLIRTVRIGLMQESYHRLVKVVENVKVEPEADKLTKQEKKDLRDILKEHKAMLDYQLEDENYIRECDNSDGGTLVDDKKRHVAFITRFFKLKLF